MSCWIKHLSRRSTLWRHKSLRSRRSSIITSRRRIRWRCKPAARCAATLPRVRSCRRMCLIRRALQRGQQRQQPRQQKREMYLLFSALQVRNRPHLSQRSRTQHFPPKRHGRRLHTQYRRNGMNRLRRRYLLRHNLLRPAQLRQYRRSRRLMFRRPRNRRQQTPQHQPQQLQQRQLVPNRRHSLFGGRRSIISIPIPTTITICAQMYKSRDSNVKWSAKH